MGYAVLFVPETATELIGDGVAPWTCGTNAEYQKCQFKLQIEKEKIFEQAARTMAAEKVLIVCDRGTLDNKAYMNETEFVSLMRTNTLRLMYIHSGTTKRLWNWNFVTRIQRLYFLSRFK